MACLTASGHLNSYIAATQLGITISSLALGWLSIPVIAHILNRTFENVPVAPNATVTNVTAFVVAFALVTALHIVMGELLPRNMAIQRPEQTTMAVASPIHVFASVFRPVIASLNWLGNQAARFAGNTSLSSGQLVQSAKELMLSINASREAGLVTQTAHDILGRAFVFTDLQARHVMVPRTEVVALPIDAMLEDVIDLTSRSSFTRLPVYDGDNDNIIGIIQTKRLLPIFLQKLAARREAIRTGEMTSTDIPFDIREYMYEPMVVPETLPATEVLSLKRESHSQLCLVIDEYGGTAGIVTLKDIVTQLVGRIQNEDGNAENDDIDQNGALHLDGLINLSELREEHQIDLQSEGFAVDTLGGYVFFSLGRPGQVGEQVTTSVGYTLTIEAMDGLRISRVCIEPATGTVEPTHSFAA